MKEGLGICMAGLAHVPWSWWTAFFFKASGGLGRARDASATACSSSGCKCLLMMVASGAETIACLPSTCRARQTHFSKFGGAAAAGRADAERVLRKARSKQK